MQAGSHDATGDAPEFSVVVATYNRARLLPRALSSIFQQRLRSFEVIVVDDGSTDETSTVLHSFSDPRLRTLRTPNRGLSAARNAGVDAARAEWVTFLDDDDEAYPSWLERFAEHTGLPSCATVCCGLVNLRGSQEQASLPADLGPAFDHVRGLFQAGTFCLRRNAFEEIGGFLPGLRQAHHTELALRLIPYCLGRDLEVRCTDHPGVRVHLGLPRARPMASPSSMLSGALVLRDRHRSALARDPGYLGNTLSVAGVSAFRLGKAGQARLLLLDAVRCRPASARFWARLALSSIPPLARRVWRVGEVSAAGPDGAGSVSALFLPTGYRENPPASSETQGQPFWAHRPSALDLGKQQPVYRLARKLAVDLRPQVVVDIGCGTGFKLVRQLASAAPRLVGVDQASAIDRARSEFPDREWLQIDLEADDEGWEKIRSMSPDLVLCVDVIEHVVSPIALLSRIRDVLTISSRLVISTPDRSRIDGAPPLGPPGNPRHVREWTESEMLRLLGSCGLTVEDSRHLLPRRYFPTPGEARRLAGRLRRRLAVPDQRYSMAFVCRLPPPLTDN